MSGITPAGRAKLNSAKSKKILDIVSQHRNIEYAGTTALNDVPTEILDETPLKELVQQKSGDSDALYVRDCHTYGICLLFDQELDTLEVDRDILLKVIGTMSFDDVCSLAKKADVSIVDLVKITERRHEE